MSKFSDSTTRRLRWRHLLPLGLLALVPIVLAPGVGAKPTPILNFGICVQNASTATLDPASCSPFGSQSQFTGNTAGATVQVTIVNDGTSTGAISSAKIALPAQMRVDATPAASPSRNVTAPDSGHILVQGVNILAGRSFVLSFNADTACAGSGVWSAVAKTTSDFSGTGSDSQSALSAGDTSTLTPGCHLSFVTQPAATATGSAIADAGGNAVQIGLVDDSTDAAMTSCPTGFSGCTVSVAPSTGTASSGTWTGIPFQTVGGQFTAPFNGTITVSNSLLPASVSLSATGDSGLAPAATSDPFDVALYVLQCHPGCSFPQKQLPFNSLTASYADLTGASGFTFMTLSPYSLGSGTPPAGCTGRPYLGVAGFAETDGRVPGGTMTIRYYVNYNALKAKYGKNVGQQFIPICSGGKPADPVTGAVTNCVNDQSGWLGDAIDPTTGAFLGGTPVHAVCNPDGFYWGILGSFQDKIPQTPTQNPVVTGWGSATISGVNYRYFDISVPPNWDWRSGP